MLGLVELLSIAVVCVDAVSDLQTADVCRENWKLTLILYFLMLKISYSIICITRAFVQDLNRLLLKTPHIYCMYQVVTRLLQPRAMVIERMSRPFTQ